jgi:hypothetical protein
VQRYYQNRADFKSHTQTSTNHAHASSTNTRRGLHLIIGKLNHIVVLHTTPMFQVTSPCKADSAIGCILEVPTKPCDVLYAAASALGDEEHWVQVGRGGHPLAPSHHYCFDEKFSSVVSPSSVGLGEMLSVPRAWPPSQHMP